MNIKHSKLILLLTILLTITLYASDANAYPYDSDWEQKDIADYNCVMYDNCPKTQCYKPSCQTDYHYHYEPAVIPTYTPTYRPTTTTTYKTSWTPSGNVWDDSRYSATTYNKDANIGINTRSGGNVWDDSRYSATTYNKDANIGINTRSGGNVWDDSRYSATTYNKDANIGINTRSGGNVWDDSRYSATTYNK
ncbi:MAG: hypothetical protein K0B02_02370, partial [DPANN group archaeon]|nr:hypothetical protein [DPANN group archaeon]